MSHIPSTSNVAPAPPAGVSRVSLVRAVAQPRSRPPDCGWAPPGTAPGDSDGRSPGHEVSTAGAHDGVFHRAYDDRRARASRRRGAMASCTTSPGDSCTVRSHASTPWRWACLPACSRASSSDASTRASTSTASREMTWADHVEAARLALPPIGAYDGRDPAAAGGHRRGRQVAAPLRRRGRPAPGARRSVPAPHGQDATAAMTTRSASRRRSSPSAPRRGLLDAITVGSVLLNQGRSTSASSIEILREEKWRHGVPETAYVLASPRGALPVHAGGRAASRTSCSRSCRCRQVNAADRGRRGRRAHARPLVRGLRARGRVRGQPAPGGSRRSTTRTSTATALYRRHDVAYEQVTKERLRSPKATVRVVHAALRGGGLHRAAAGLRGAVVVTPPLDSTPSRRASATRHPRAAVSDAGVLEPRERCVTHIRVRGSAVGHRSTQRHAGDATRAGGDPRPSSVRQYVAQ